MRDVATNTIESKALVRDYYEQLHFNKLET